ncbi:YgfZ/GcvT domain-containing protein [Idiomarina sp.]|uniref:CAF17-like 4Fe-4S cluster assembly/insertion protein YgfZ n=1 Tax=Idiomarina sp. TaxID=1874361 RepID=UPI003A912551
MVELTQHFTDANQDHLSVQLVDYGILSVSGEDADSFLQGQLTCDLRKLGQDNCLYGAHCDQTGKAFSIFWLYRENDSVFLVMHRSAIEGSLAQLKKFGVFSKVIIEDVSNDWNIAGVFGSKAASVAAEFDGRVIQVGTSPDQYLLLSQQPISTDYPQPYWDALEIERVRPQLTSENIQAFVPQMMNLQAWDGISFDKGCYIGQETIARMKYLGKQKRALFRLSGKVTAQVTAGTQLEKAIGENWRRAGTVIMAVNRTDTQVDLLAVLPSDINTDTAIRVRDDDASLLEIHSLPYQLG